MGSSEFNEILNKIAGDIMRMDTVMCDSVMPKETGILHQGNPGTTSVNKKLS